MDESNDFNWNREARRDGFINTLLGQWAAKPGRRVNDLDARAADHIVSTAHVMLAAVEARPVEDGPEQDGPAKPDKTTQSQTDTPPDDDE